MTAAGPCTIVEFNTTDPNWEQTRRENPDYYSLLTSSGEIILAGVSEQTVKCTARLLKSGHIKYEFRSAQNKLLAHTEIPLKSIVAQMKAYKEIVARSLEAIRYASPSACDAIDNARTEIHNAGTNQLIKLLGEKFVPDFETARNIFRLTTYGLTYK